jgi:CspA family cold shock protein
MGERILQSIDGAEGQVKWFDPRKGFGFIVGPEGQDIFTHYSVIKGEGFRVLKDGANVQYDAVLTEKGWKATRVTRSESVEVPAAKRGYTRTPRQRSDGGAPPAGA